MEGLLSTGPTPSSLLLLFFNSKVVIIYSDVIFFSLSAFNLSIDFGMCPKEFSQTLYFSLGSLSCIKVRDWNLGEPCVPLYRSIGAFHASLASWGFPHLVSFKRCFSHISGEIYNHFLINSKRLSPLCRHFSTFCGGI